MKLLATITTQDINPNSPPVDRTNFNNRIAVRAVVLNAHNQVALMEVGQKGYHKLPGGGVEEGEILEEALERELLEEIGIHADVVTELGAIHEYWDEKCQYQISYCYIARQRGDQQEAHFTEEEKQKGFQSLWVKRQLYPQAIIAVLRY